MQIVFEKNNRNMKSRELDEIFDMGAGVAARLRMSYAQLFDSKAWLIVKKEFGLTNREIQVAILMCKGCSWQAITDKLGIKQGTLNTHKSTLYRKVRVSNVQRLVLKLILATGELLPEDEKDFV